MALFIGKRWDERSLKNLVMWIKYRQSIYVCEGLKLEIPVPQSVVETLKAQ